MKQSFLITALIFVYAASVAQTKSYTITGTVPNRDFNGKYIYLFDPDKSIKTDSTLIQDGTFSFQGKIEGNFVRNITINRNTLSFIFEGGDITINLATHTVGGSPLNDILNKYYEEMREVIMSANKIYREMKKDTSIKLADRKAKINKLWAKTDDKRIEIAKFYIKTNKDNALGALIISKFICPGEQMKMFDAVYSLAGDYALNFQPIVATAKRYEAIKKTQAGMLFMDFTIKNGNMDGTQISLSDYVGKGKYILVDFWASWCGPCRAEIPNIEKVYNEFNGDNFDVLSIAVWDKRENTLKAAKEHNVKWNQIVDAQHIPTDLYGISGIPQIMLFGPDGKIVARGLRGENIRKKVAEILGK